MILGIDEVGRGPWAGPLVVGAVVLGGIEIEGLTDSKKLSKKKREALDIIIRESAAGFGLGWVTANEIDEIGLSEALVLATKRAVEQVKTPYQEIIIDGTVNFLSDTNKGKYVTTLKKADLLVPSVSAASIIAKVARDRYMEMQDEIHPGYGFKNHVGYGTAEHIAAIEKLGVTPLHRLSFGPLQKYSISPSMSKTASGFAVRSAPKSFLPKVKTFLGTAPHSLDSEATRGSSFGSTKQIGDLAERQACEYLKKIGHKIIDRNWKTKYCEIDIISQKDSVIFFNEVKYRNKPDQGGGLAAITPKKSRQMKFAAEYYSVSNDIHDKDLRLAVISVCGRPPIVDQFLEIF